jgi:hypothetical protein
MISFHLKIRTLDFSKFSLPFPFQGRSNKISLCPAKQFRLGTHTQAMVDEINRDSTPSSEGLKATRSSPAVRQRSATMMPSWRPFRGQRTSLQSATRRPTTVSEAVHGWVPVARGAQGQGAVRADDEAQPGHRPRFQQRHALCPEVGGPQVVPAEASQYPILHVRQLCACWRISPAGTSRAWTWCRWSMRSRWRARSVWAAVSAAPRLRQRRAQVPGHDAGPVDLRSAFTFRQAYVALSRARDMKHLTVRS